mgnify:CR=1 FL=1|tara:strand:+ start:445 stop:1569 length:1125 start_codon:yes stop_codon:yes gene_type:complete
MKEYTEPVNFIDLNAQQKTIRENLELAINRVLDHGNYIMGPEVLEFEKMLKDFTRSKNVFSCANGTDALTIAMMALEFKAGDIVFVPSFTYIASAEAAALLGITPFFVDVDEETFNISAESLKLGIKEARKLNLNPVGIIAVDLFGQPADYNEIRTIASKEGLKIIADGAQSLGATFYDKNVGLLGDISTTSFFPAKPMGCYGDGGAIFTDSDVLAEKINSIRLHGRGAEKYDHTRLGVNSRLDTIQAAILIEKLKIFPKEIQMRNEIAKTYNKIFKDCNYIKTPKIRDGIISTWAQYTLIVDKRDEFQKKLRDIGIPSVIYYPKPLSKQPGYKNYPSVSSGTPVSERLCKEVLSLPMHPYLKKSTIEDITNIL